MITGPLVCKDVIVQGRGVLQNVLYMQNIHATSTEVKCRICGEDMGDPFDDVTPRQCSCGAGTINIAPPVRAPGPAPMGPPLWLKTAAIGATMPPLPPSPALAALLQAQSQMMQQATHSVIIGSQAGRMIVHGNWITGTSVYSGPIEASCTADERARIEALAAKGSRHAAATLARKTPHEGIRAGEVTGWRVWKVHDENSVMARPMDYGLTPASTFEVEWDEQRRRFRHKQKNLKLESLTTETLWEPGKPMEGDIEEYGVYSSKTSNDAVQVAFEMISCGGHMVIGQIDLWGEIVEHEHGYRAQYAKIRSLDSCYNGAQSDDDTLEKLRKIYNVAG